MEPLSAQLSRACPGARCLAHRSVRLNRLAQRRANAMREVRRMAAKGKQVSPVEIAGRAIASTFWGKAWCDNLESYSDFSNRLPRGRTYLRNGSVVDLQIETGKIMSMVSGASLYRIAIRIRPLAAPRWKKLKQECGTGIGSVVELLQGRLSTSVMSVVTSRENGLFPAPAEIEMSCSCPDWAEMCKHVAATLYSVGNPPRSPARTFLQAAAGRPPGTDRPGGPSGACTERRRQKGHCSRPVGRRLRYRTGDEERKNR